MMSSTRGCKLSDNLGVWGQSFLNISFVELLDATDPSLAFAVYGASQLNIFPIAVMDIKIPGSNEQRELLLCFNGKVVCAEDSAINFLYDGSFMSVDG